MMKFKNDPVISSHVTAASSKRIGRLTEEFAAGVVHAAALHDGERLLYDVRGEDLLVCQRAHAAICQRRRQDAHDLARRLRGRTADQSWLHP